MKTQQSLNLTFRCLAISNYHYAVHPMLTHLFLSLSRSNYKNTPRKERIFRMNLFGQWTFRSEHIRLNTAVHQPTRINKYLFYPEFEMCFVFWNWFSYRNVPTCLFQLGTYFYIENLPFAFSFHEIIHWNLL